MLLRLNTLQIVNPGQVKSWKNTENFYGDKALHFFHLPQDWTHSELASFNLIQHSKVSLNVSAETNHFSSRTKPSQSQVVYLITFKGDKWGIQAGSVIEV